MPSTQCVHQLECCAVFHRLAIDTVRIHSFPKDFGADNSEFVDGFQRENDSIMLRKGSGRWTVDSKNI